MTVAGATASDTATETIAFPSAAWFERLAELMAEQRDHFVQLGSCDCVGQVTIWDGPGGDEWRCQVAFEEYGVSSVRVVTEDDEPAADFILETDLDTWQDMVASIVEGGGTPGLKQTINYLAMPGTPIRCWSHDPLGRDAFFRFNQTIQHFLNNCASFTTEWLDAG